MITSAQLTGWREHGRVPDHAPAQAAALRAINNIDIVVPADNFETREAIKRATERSTPVYIRFGKAPLYDLKSEISNLQSEISNLKSEISDWRSRPYSLALSFTLGSAATLTHTCTCGVPR